MTDIAHNQSKVPSTLPTLPDDEKALRDLIKIDTTLDPTERFNHALSVASRVVDAAQKGREFSARSISQVLYGLGKTWSDLHKSLPGERVSARQRNPEVFNKLMRLASIALKSSNQRDIVQIVVSCSTLRCGDVDLFRNAAECILKEKDTFQVRDAAQMLAAFAIAGITQGDVIDEALQELRQRCIQNEHSLTALDVRDLARSASISGEANTPLLEALIRAAERCRMDFNSPRAKRHTYDALCSFAEMCERSMPIDSSLNWIEAGARSVKKGRPTRDGRIHNPLGESAEAGKQIRSLIRDNHISPLQRLQRLVEIGCSMAEETAPSRGVSAWNVAQLMYGIDQTLARAREVAMDQPAAHIITSSGIRTKLPQVIAEVFERCNAQDIAQIATGSIAMNLRINCQLIAEQVMQISDRKIRDVAQVAVALARVGWGDASSPLFRDLPDICIREEGKLRAYDVGDLARACVLRELYDPKIYEVLVRSALRCRRTQNFRRDSYRSTVEALEKIGRYYPDQEKAREWAGLLRHELEAGDGWKGHPQGGLGRMTELAKDSVEGLLQKYCWCSSDEGNRLQNIEDELGQRACDLGVRDIADIGQAIAEKGRRNIELCERLLARWSRVKSRANLDVTATFAWAMARLAIPQDRLFDDVATSMANKSPRPEFSVLAKAAWSVSLYDPALVKKMCSITDLECVTEPQAWLHMYHALLLSGEMRASQTSLRPHPSWNLGARSESVEFARDVRAWLHEQGIDEAKVSLAKAIAHVVADVVIDAGGGRKIIVQCHSREKYLAVGPDGGEPFGEHQLYDRLISQVFGSKVFHLIKEDFYGSQEGCMPILRELRKKTKS